MEHWTSRNDQELESNRQFSITSSNVDYPLQNYQRNSRPSSMMTAPILQPSQLSNNFFDSPLEKINIDRDCGNILDYSQQLNVHHNHRREENHSNFDEEDSNEINNENQSNNGPPLHHNHSQRNPFMKRSNCVVCGDRARGCNFGSITCASCKEFFRRNAFKSDKLKCYFQSRCEINIYSRRFCAACRLEKCYRMGMRNDYIMTEGNRKHRSSSNQLKIYTDNDEHGEDGDVDAKEWLYELKMCSNRAFEVPNLSNGTGRNNERTNSSNFLNDLNKNLKTSPIVKSSSSSSTSSFKHSHQHSNQSEDDDRYTIDHSETVIRLLKKVKIIREGNYTVNKFHLLLLTKDKIRQNLSERDSCRLKYLTSIVQIFSAETIADLPIDRKFIDLIRIAEIVTFNFIKLCKKLYTFQALDQEDQVALVKGGVMDSLMIWSMMTINLEKECWEALDLERNFKFSLKMEMLKEANPKLYEKHRSYVLSFEPEWRSDDNLMSLLMAIALFNPDQSNIVNIEMIRNERNTYCDLLKLYVTTLYKDSSSSDEIYRRLLNQLKLTKTISEYHMNAYFDLNTNFVNKKNLSGLIMEIFDLNN
ncbi:Nuclear hormone receptor HR96 [Sarcoptes scabiei]|uniref:Nuclear hormone receptor HR96 n=1 Tax=Sarcoptes scabiei TaxID=52283 RepID=A0A834R1Q1_SARSC|nr:Nuclear hormone receptor HR96 [Sarcoptes scabiei]